MQIGIVGLGRVRGDGVRRPALLRKGFGRHSVTARDVKA